MRKVLVGGMVGNALEWYDYALFAQFAPILGMHFFPDSEIREILTFAVFATGFIVRPLGGVIFGNIGDRFGRKIALMLGIITMAIPTAAIGLLPSYAAIGVAAPILLAITRLLQGFSLGGEFSSCITYIVEYAPIERRGLAGSAPFVSMCIGMLLGSLTAWILSQFMLKEEIVAWGWRIPFIGGFFIGLVGLYIRSQLSESPLYQEAKAHKVISATPFRDTVTKHWRQLLVGMGIYLSVTTPFYTLTVFVESFMQKIGYSAANASMISAIILTTIMIILPLSAMLSDRIGRKPVLIIGAVCIMLCAYPSFYILGQMNIMFSAIAMTIFSGILGFYMGPVPTVLVELFPTRVRLTGVALSYNISAALFGGTAPMVGMMFVQFTGDKFAIAYYLSVIAVVTLFILRFFVESYHKKITDE
jgi:MHS family proline/betaine transporter-like MFS transporter